MMRREASCRNHPSVVVVLQKNDIPNTPVDFKTALLALPNVGDLTVLQREAFEKTPLADGHCGRGKN
ncbi:hypothetical protein BGS_1396 [Beggiatoa sp. SS]|nr:hypothetical protein BGS_1396 [Beggiatoa sp. SS]